MGRELKHPGRDVEAVAMASAVFVHEERERC